jgi:hypothetical protein
MDRQIRLALHCGTRTDVEVKGRSPSMMRNRQRGLQTGKGASVSAFAHVSASKGKVVTCTVKDWSSTRPERRTIWIKKEGGNL